MAKPALLFQPVLQFFDNSGNVLSGGTLAFKEAGTSTDKDTYTDSTKGTANPNPITLDSAGRPDNAGSPIQIWLDGSYKLIVKDSSGNTIRTEDNITALAEATGYAAKTANYTITTDDYAKLINVDTSSSDVTISLPAAATAGAGFIVYVSKSSSDTNTVIIDGNSTETINGDTTHTFLKQYDLAGLISDGSNWTIREFNSDWAYFDDAKGILDSNGNELLIFQETSSAVNYTEITNEATGNDPIIASAGDDTNVGLTIDTQGTGAITLGSADTGGVTVTNGGLTVTAGGLTVTDGDAAISSGALTVTDEDSRTNTVDDLLTLTSTTDGTPAAGIGTGVLFQAESGDENPSDFGRVSFEATDVSAGSEDTDYVIQTRQGGNALSDAYKFRVTGASNYIFTGAPASERTITLPDNDYTFSPAYVSATISSSQSISHNTWTKVQLATELADANGDFDNATNYRFVAPVTGDYLITAFTQFNLGVGNKFWSGLEIYKNGSTTGYKAQNTYEIGVGNYPSSAAVSVILNLTASTDYIELYVYQENSGSASGDLTNCALSIVQLQ